MRKIILAILGILAITGAILLGNYLVDKILLEETNIKTIVAIYPGRFQPMGAHHAKTFK